MRTLVNCSLAQAELIRFNGDDALSFLQNLLTCDVTALGTQRSTNGAFCTPKGRMLASFLLWRSDAGYFMQLPASLREPIQKQLSRFILRSKVKVEDATPAWSLIGIAGHDAAALVKVAIGQVPASVRDVVHSNGMTAIHVPTGRYEIVLPKEKLESVLATLAPIADKADPAYWEWLDIRAGIPVITPATQEALVPQMANLDLIGGVSFEKGCYPGQEIVARMHYRGTLKQRMYLAHIAGDGQPQPGDRLYSPDFGEQACGTVINAARAPDGGFDILAAIQIASATKGKVNWKTPDGPALKFLPLPYPVPVQE